MLRRFGLITAIVAVLALAYPALAQEAEKSKSDSWSFYKLQINVREIDGSKTLNSRSYDLNQRAGEWGQLRVGSRVPVATGTAGGPNTQYQYVDIGLNIDSRVQDHNGEVSFDWRLNLSSAAPDPSPGGPVVRNVQSNGQTLLAIGKPVVMTTVDDLNSTHKFVFEVTATKVK
jgi:hypothetical protein